MYNLKMLILSFPAASSRYLIENLTEIIRTIRNGVPQGRVLATLLL